jgi:Spy/CpxP family protein refolding chaperone
MKSFMKDKMFRAAAVLLCGAGLMVSAAVAQQDAAPPPPPDGQQQGPPMGGPHGMDPVRHAAMMQRRLDLTAGQTAQLQQIFTEEQAQMEALRSNTALAPEDRRAQMMGLHQGVQTRIRAVLTPDQQTKFDAMQARMRERRMGGRNEGAPPPPPPSEPPAPQL